MPEANASPSLKKPLIAAGLLIGFVLVMTAGVRLTGQGAWRAADSPAVETLSLKFHDREDGAVVVVDAATDAEIFVYGAGSHGFIRSTVRAVARHRKLAGLPPDEPFALQRLADGRLVLADPLTGRFVGLNGFGAPNVEEFAQLFEATGTVQ